VLSLNKGVSGPPDQLSHDVSRSVGDSMPNDAKAFCFVDKLDIRMSISDCCVDDAGILEPIESGLELEVLTGGVFPL
jgi:hypothetical protein